SWSEPGALNGEDVFTPQLAAKPDGKAKGAKAASGEAPAAASGAATDALDSIHALQLIRAYRARGHQAAILHSLQIHATDSHPALYYRTHGFTDADLDRPIQLGGVLGFTKATLREIVDALKNTYCGTIGVEFTHVQDPAQKAWLQRRIETDRLT